MKARDSEKEIFGLMAEFDTADELIAAAQKAHDEGYRAMDAHSPFPIHGLSEALGLKPTRIPSLVLAGGIIGGTSGFLLQTITAVYDYPLNIGGRPFLSLPSFVPITFECTILGAALTAAFSMLILNGFPKPYHPVFNVEAFGRASSDRFFLCIELEDPKFDPQATKKFLEGLRPHGVYEVEE